MRPSGLALGGVSSKRSPIITNPSAYHNLSPKAKKVFRMIRYKIAIPKFHSPPQQKIPKPFSYKEDVYLPDLQETKSSMDIGHTTTNTTWEAALSNTCCTRAKSILVSSNLYSPILERTDYYGVSITSKKEHRVTFSDLDGGELLTVREVESYKKYNLLDTPITTEFCTKCAII